MNTVTYSHNSHFTHNQGGWAILGILGIVGCADRRVA